MSVFLLMHMMTGLYTVTIVILNIRFHRKDNFQPIELQQFVVYCLETHVSYFVYT